MRNKQAIARLLIFYFLSTAFCFAQEAVKIKKLGKVSKLFLTDSILPIKMSYSFKELRKNTNDSTYLNIDLTYEQASGDWQSIPVRVRARGNFRLKKCYFSPVKMRIKKGEAKGTLFKGNKELKLVLPCLLAKNADDYVIKELIAYKLYELASPYHFKTRLLDITIIEPKGNKIKEHQLKGFFIEDIGELADRFGGEVLKRNVHPMQQETLSSIRNEFFQFMIGNTDYSAGYQHNQKLLFINKNAVPVPYDFDMSGLCDTSYSVVSQIKDQELPISEVTERLYRGFKRGDAMMFQVKNEFLENQEKMLGVIDAHETYFTNPKEFVKCKKYIQGFFDVLTDSARFQRDIMTLARIK
jgi:hypothetical protein